MSFLARRASRFSRVSFWLCVSGFRFYRTRTAIAVAARDCGNTRHTAHTRFLLDAFFLFASVLLLVSWRAPWHGLGFGGFTRFLVVSKRALACFHGLCCVLRGGKWLEEQEEETRRVACFRVPCCLLSWSFQEAGVGVLAHGLARRRSRAGERWWWRRGAA